MRAHGILNIVSIRNLNPSSHITIYCHMFEMQRKNILKAKMYLGDANYNIVDFRSTLLEQSFPVLLLSEFKE